MFGRINQKEKFLYVIAFLASIPTLLSTNIKEKIDQGKVKPQDSELFIRANVGSGNNTINLLEGKTSKEIGVSNIDGQILNSDRYFVIDAVTVNYGIAASATSPKAVDFSTTLPLALKNANLVIKQDNEVIINLPVAAINDAKATDERYRVLAAFALLRDQKTIEITIEFPSGSDLAPGAGNSGFVEVLLKGMETYIKR
ncbi:hypothetical protein [Abyssalbus ytuae]|uniref:Uncharacterized protein n=1 Tax=Abyssalbus ytuae TaxID=2926907 RepID=A0A9E7A0F7_9FLAO|nr:hypothetical protein [Abyssalbus ytuae]UOB18592.1 hypothetical protein MQE35_04710 [Abyssalbus ytuae]